MSEMWRMTVELEFPVDPEDLRVKHSGDEEVDFSRRAWIRVQGGLNDLVGGETFKHYNVTLMPRR